jgi:hypothetical protein
MTHQELINLILYADSEPEIRHAQAERAAWIARNPAATQVELFQIYEGSERLEMLAEGIKLRAEGKLPPEVDEADEAVIDAPASN